ncbi:hypothetical protein EMIT0111MI5_190004 [Burkholderia sp. IT-111MI5]
MTWWGSLVRIQSSLPTNKMKGSAARIAYRQSGSPNRQTPRGNFAWRLSFPGRNNACCPRCVARDSRHRILIGIPTRDTHRVESCAHRSALHRKPPDFRRIQTASKPHQNYNARSARLRANDHVRGHDHRIVREQRRNRRLRRQESRVVRAKVGDRRIAQEPAVLELGSLFPGPGLDGVSLHVLAGGRRAGRHARHHVGRVAVLPEILRIKHARSGHHRDRSCARLVRERHLQDARRSQHRKAAPERDVKPIVSRAAGGARRHELACGDRVRHRDAAARFTDGHDPQRRGRDAVTATTDDRQSRAEKQEEAGEKRAEGNIAHVHDTRRPPRRTQCKCFNLSGFRTT